MDSSWWVKYNSTAPTVYIDLGNNITIQMLVSSHDSPQVLIRCRTTILYSWEDLSSYFLFNSWILYYCLPGQLNSAPVPLCCQILQFPPTILAFFQSPLYQVYITISPSRSPSSLTPTEQFVLCVRVINIYIYHLF